MKKIIKTLLFGFALIFAMKAQAMADISQDGKWSFVTKDGTSTSNDILVCRYHGSDSEVTVPSTIDGKNVVGTKDGLSDSNKNITKVTFSDGFKSLDDDTFYDCEQLTDIYFPDSTEFIDYSAIVYAEDHISNPHIINIHGNRKNSIVYSFAVANHHADKNGWFVRDFGYETVFYDNELGKRSVITYYLNGGTNNADNPGEIYEGETITLKDPVRNGFVFLGWYDINDRECRQKVTQIPTGNTVNRMFVAHWASPDYKVKFNGNGSTSGSMADMVIALGESKTLTANAFKKNGYTFVGWNTRADGKGKAYSDKATVKDLTSETAITLYAQWKPATYKITYKLDGGKNSSSNPSKYSITTSTITLKAAKKDGYKFAGWYTSSKFTKKVTEIKKGSTGDRTIYAKWTPISYKIKFNANGGKGTMKTLSVKYDKSVKLTKNAFKRDGYTFLGWASKKTAKKADYKNQQTVKKLTKTDGKTITLYAVWKKNK